MALYACIVALLFIGMANCQLMPGGIRVMTEDELQTDEYLLQAVDFAVAKYNDDTNSR